MRKTTLIALVGLATTASPARAQFNFLAPGSTPQGDYLRAVGVAAYGEGYYNLSTAQANSINTDTSIRLNEYLEAFWAREFRGAAAIREARHAAHEASYKAVLERIRDQPEERDVQNGDGLNSLIDRLNDPRYESSYRSEESRVTIPGDYVRRLPFRIDAEGQAFSLQRLQPRGKAKWPVALQDDRFAPQRLAYEHAVDAVLERQVGGKMSIDSIRVVREAVEGLDRALEAWVAPGKAALYRESHDRIRELRQATALFESHKVEQALGEIDKYAGTTVNDLRQFMQKYKLHFAPSATADERALYPKLYESLRAQLALMTDVPKEPRK